MDGTSSLVAGLIFHGELVVLIAICMSNNVPGSSVTVQLPVPLSCDFFFATGFELSPKISLSVECDNRLLWP